MLEFKEEAVRQVQRDQMVEIAKLKRQLAEQARREAIADVREYVELYYNSKRVHPCR